MESRVNCERCGRQCSGATGYRDELGYHPLCHSDFHPSCYVAWTLDNAADLDEWLKAYERH